MGTASSAADVGADYIAVELAVALRKLGSAVTLVGAGRHLLLEVDAALVPLAERGVMDTSKPRSCNCCTR